MSIYECESCLTNQTKYIDGGNLPITLPGQPNVGFNIGSGFPDGSVESIQIQSDGKILVGGYFNEYSGTTVGQSLIRLESNGLIDTSFDIGDGFSNNFYSDIGYINSIQIQSDGKIIVGGQFDEYSGTSVGYSLIRLNTDGSIDTSFDVGTGFKIIGDSGYISSIRIQSDGKIIVGGQFDEYSGTSVGFGLIRLNTDGSIDTSFDVGTGFSNFGGTIYIQIQSDGKILVGGTFDQYSGTSVGNNLIRLETDGSIDTSFDVGTGFNNGEIYTIQIQTDGKIIVGGYFDEYSGTSVGQSLIRINTDGSIDTSFNVGTGFSNFGGTSYINSIQIQSDGKILVGGTFDQYSGTSVGNNLIRLETDGSIDTSFDVGTGFNDPVRTIVLKSDGKILVGGYFGAFNEFISNRICQIETNENINIIYSTDFNCYIPQKIYSEFYDFMNFNIGTGFNSTVSTIQLQSDGKILVGGFFTTYSGVSSNRIIRLNTDGSIDTSFVIGTGFNNPVFTIQLQPDGKILAGGSFSSYSGVTRNSIVRLNTDGSIDNSFIIGFGFNNQLETIKLQPDGKILVGGFFNSYSGVTRNFIVRLNTNGSIDNSFVIGTGFNQFVRTIQLQPDGKILVGGFFNSYSGISSNRMIILNTDGSIDTSFVIGYGFNDEVRTIQLRTDGKILVGGQFTSYGGYDPFSLNLDFIPNTNSNITYSSIKTTSGKIFIGTNSSFEEINENGETIMTKNLIGEVLSLEELSDSNILLSGSFTSYNGSLNGGLVKVDTSGNKVFGFDVGYGFNGVPVYTTKELPSGKILVGGEFTSSGNTLFIFGFNCGIFDNSIFDATEQPDGKIIAGGTFTQYSGVFFRNRIIRLNTDGSIDTSFVIGSGFGSTVRTIELQPDGKILVGGDFTNYSGVSINRIIRLNTDGSIDTSFVVGTGFNSSVNTIQIQPDGKILVSGNFTSYSGITRNRIIRLNTDGSVDNSFVIGTGFGNGVNAMQLQSDGKILAVGLFTSYSGLTRNRIIRLNTDGSVDSSFSIGTGFGVTSTLNTIQLQSDGKILVGGTFTSYAGTTRRNIVRINTTGTVDTSFVIGTGFTASSTVNSINVRPDGKILVGGNFTSYSGVTRNRIIGLNTDGSIDNSFFVGNGADNTVRGFIPKTGFTFVYGDFITINGSFQNQISKLNYSANTGITVNRFTRINSDGSYDTTFSANTGFTSTVRKIDIQPDNKIIVAGDFTSYSGQQTNRILRLNTDYTLDTSFDKIYTVNGIINDFELLSDGKILIGGNFDLLQPTLNFDSTTLQSAVQPDGKILVVGEFTTINGTSYNGIVRLNTGYTIDTSFVIGTGFDSSVFTIELQPDGKILVGGNFTSYSGVSRNNIIRLNTDGSIDTSFVIGTGFNVDVYSIQLQSDGKILVGGSFTSYSGVTRNNIIRLNANGSIDETFDIGVGFNNVIFSIELQSDGKILVGGAFTSYSGVSINNIIRLNTDGSVDTSFVVGTGFNDQILSIQTQSNGKILVGGGFTSYSGVSSNRIIRLNTDGSVDTSFVVGTGFNNLVYTIELSPIDNGIIVGGSFTTYKGLTYNYIVKINDSGFAYNPFNNFNGAIYSITVKDNSNVIICGEFTSYYDTTQNRFTSIDIFNNNKISLGIPCGNLIRLNNNGSIDLSYNYQNIPSLQGGQINTIEVLSGGSISVGGDFDYYGSSGGGSSTRSVALFDSEGNITEYAPYNGGNSVLTLTQISDELLLVGGLIITFDGVNVNSICAFNLIYFSGTTFNRISLLNYDGTPDMSVNLGTGFNNVVRTIELQPNGKIVVGGNFTSYSGVPINNIAILNSDYSYDNSFNDGYGFNNSVNTIQLQPDGKILAGGSFQYFDVQYSPSIARILTSPNTVEYQAILLFNECEECNGYIIPISANTEYDECRICDNVAVSVDPPHPVWTGLNGGSVTQMNAVLLGGNGLNS